MQIYHYKNDTKEYVGTSMARRDPLEKEREDLMWIIPANATTSPPPVTAKNQTAVWTGERWALRDDFRGTDYWDVYGNKYTIEKIGEKPPEDAVLTPPEVPDTPPPSTLRQAFEDAKDFAAMKAFLRELIFKDDQPRSMHGG